MHEAWEATREHYLILREEPSEEEYHPNPAFDALAEMNVAMRKADEEGAV